MTEKEIEKRKYFARQRRYRKPICRDMNFEAICNELDEIQEACEDVSRKKLLQVQTDLASKIILYGETEEKLSQLRVVDKALNRN